MGKNVLLFFMSLYTNLNNPQTNATVIKELMNDSKDRPDVMIALCSESVRTKNTVTIGGEGMTTWDYFNDIFMPRLKPEFELHELPRLECVPVPDSLQEADQAYAIHEVVKHINSDDHLYIDMTGGMRDTAMLLITTARYLRDIRQIDTTKIRYAESITPYGDKHPQYVTRDCNQLYKLFDLISATDEFFSTGSARKLQKYFDAEPTTDPDTKRLLEHINTFSSDLALCRMTNNTIENDLRTLSETLSAHSKPQGTPSGINDLFFDLLEERFEKEFHNLPKQGEEILPYLTRWCVNHGLYQQALTLLAENMPQFVCEHIFLQPTEYEWNWLKKQEQNAGCKWPSPFFHSVLGSQYIKWQNKRKNEEKSALDYLNENQLLLQFDPTSELILVKAIDNYALVIASRNHINHAGNNRYNGKIANTLAHLTEDTIHSGLSEIADLLECIKPLHRNIPNGVTPRDLNERFPVIS